MSIMTDDTTANILTPRDYWQGFITDWQNVAQVAWEAGQDEVSAFLTELVLDAEALCMELGWPMPSVN
jgi:hypothetical protein